MEDITETLVKYINFAKTYGLDIWDFEITMIDYEYVKVDMPEPYIKKPIYWVQLGEFNISLIELITSPSFIDKIAEWLYTVYVELLKEYNVNAFYGNKSLNDFKYLVIKDQAFSIYNGTLENYINNLLPKC